MISYQFLTNFRTYGIIPILYVREKLHEMQLYFVRDSVMEDCAILLLVD